MSATNESANEPSLASRLRDVHVGLREDLDVTRHLFRGDASYIVRDPITFQTQRLSPTDYALFTHISPDQTLGSIFSSLVETGKVAMEEEELFYRFVLSLHRIGFLHLPIADDKLLFRRYLLKQRARRREKILGFLFLRMPLWNPDAFLNRTMRFVAPLFGRTVFIAWIMLMLAAAYVASRRWDSLAQPLQGVLVSSNLLVMWFTLIGLKVFHELGHAFACKHYGGHVPETGVYWVVFTPCAYMDATASWAFTSKRQRIIVCLAGMYIESILAAIAVLVWANTGPGMVHDLAYNVIFLAGIVTVLFNINPLLRYDGYYIASDFFEIPNLRARATQHVLVVCKRLLLGIRSAQQTTGRRLRAILLSYGLAATVYRAFLLFTIAGILVWKMHTLGLILATMFLGSAVFSIVRKLVGYLWHGEETQAVRFRAVVLGSVVLLALPSALFFVPLPSHVRVMGLVTAEHETVVRAPAAGVVQQASLAPGQTVTPSDLLVSLSNVEVEEALTTATAHLEAAKIRRNAFQVENRVRYQQELQQIGALEFLVVQRQEESRALQVRAPVAGRLVRTLRDRDVGSFLEEGAVIATVVSGAPRIRTIVTAEQLVAAHLAKGDPAVFRPVGAPGLVLRGTVERVTPGGVEALGGRGLDALTLLGGGDVLVDPVTGVAQEPYYEVLIALECNPDGSAAGSKLLPYGMTGVVRFNTPPEPVGTKLARRVLSFWNRLAQG